MQQLEIKYFFPLTEQMTLDLDFTKSETHEKQKLNTWLNNSGTVLISNGGTVSWATVTGSAQPSFTIDIDQTPITIKSKEKPNFIRRYIYKALGMKWKV